MYRICKTCSVEKPIEEYYRHPHTKAGYHIHCKECQKKKNKDHQRANKDHYLDKDFRRHYGISLSDYNTMFALQYGKCSICKRHQTEFNRRLSVDHNHETGQVRGLLCASCNTAIGALKEDVVLFRSAMAYLGLISV